MRRLRYWVASVCFIASAIYAAQLKADQPSHPATAPTTQYVSVAAVFESIPSDKVPPEPKTNATDLQTQVLREHVDTANQWLAKFAVGNPVKVIGKVTSASAVDDRGIQLLVRTQDPKGYGVTCLFSKSDKDRLLKLNEGDSVAIDGKLTVAKYELNGEVSFTGFGTSSVTKLMFEDIEVGDCRLLEK